MSRRKSVMRFTEPYRHVEPAFTVTYRAGDAVPAQVRDAAKGAG